MPESKCKPPYTFSTHIGAACAKNMRTFPDLAEKLKMDVTDLMRQCNGKVPPSKALVKGLVRSWTSMNRSSTGWRMRSEGTLDRNSCQLLQLNQDQQYSRGFT